MALRALALISLLSLSITEKPVMVPVAPFKNMCALTPNRITEFLTCCVNRAIGDERTELVEEFKNQIKNFKDLTMGEIARMMCRSLGNDGFAALNSYVDSIENEDDQKYMLDSIRLCGGPSLTAE